MIVMVHKRQYIKREGMTAKEHLEIALGGNMNISTLTPLAWHEIMEDYANRKIKELEAQSNWIDVNKRELLLDFAEYSENDKASKWLDECVYLDTLKKIKPPTE